MLGLFTFSLATVAAAEELPRGATLLLVLATKAETAALEKCEQDGYRVSVAVVDRAGCSRY
jgi:uncharacterized protein GlcG (DUF336 family)